MHKFWQVPGWILRGQFNEITTRVRPLWRRLRFRLTDQFYLRLFLPYLMYHAPQPAADFLALRPEIPPPAAQLNSQIKQLTIGCNRIVAGDLSDFSAVYQPLDPPDNERLNWFRDYHTGWEWPVRFYRQMDYTTEQRPGDIRTMWEIHRHLFFPLLAAGFTLQGEEQYASFVRRHWLDWLNRNPIGCGIGWIAPQIQENAIRNISWILVYVFLQDSRTLTATDQRTFRRAIYQQGCFLNHYFDDKKEISHNHLISEAGGLALTGMFFRNHSFGRRWLRRGLRTLEQAIIFQVHPDGVQGEFSLNYHAFVLETILLVYSFGQRLGLHFDGEFSEALHGMLKHINAMTRPDGTLPRFADTDNATAWALSPHRLEDRHRYVTTGAALFSDSKLKTPTAKFHLETWLRLGEDGWRRWLETPTGNEADRQFFFPSMNTLCSSFRTENRMEQLIIRGGGAVFPTGIGTSHNHADYLSFTWWVDGEELLIDPGTFAYSLDDRWRYYFRSATAHNTIDIDGENMLDVTSMRFGVPSIFPVETVAQEFHPEYSFLHLRYHKQTRLNQWQHDRLFLHINPGLLLIRDRVLCPGRHRLQTHFQLAGNYKKDKTRSLMSLRRLKQGPALYFATSPDDITLDYGDEIKPAGWYSHRYGVRQALTSAQAGVVFTDSIQFDTILDARAAWQPGKELISLELNSVKITIALNGSGITSVTGFQQSPDRFLK